MGGVQATYHEHIPSITYLEERSFEDALHGAQSPTIPDEPVAMEMGCLGRPAGATSSQQLIFARPVARRGLKSNPPRVAARNAKWDLQGSFRDQKGKLSTSVNAVYDDIPVSERREEQSSFWPRRLLIITTFEQRPSVKINCICDVVLYSFSLNEAETASAIQLGETLLRGGW